MKTSTLVILGIFAILTLMLLLTFSVPSKYTIGLAMFGSPLIFIFLTVYILRMKPDDSEPVGEVPN